jgi:hypothetical protein
MDNVIFWRRLCAVCNEYEAVMRFSEALTDAIRGITVDGPS